MAFFLPALPVTLGWILLFDPTYGLMNQALHTLLGVTPFNIYGFWGIVWAHLANISIAIKVMLLTPAFRNMDASLEEASNMSGSSTFGTVWRILLPVMTPVLTVVAPAVDRLCAAGLRDRDGAGLPDPLLCVQHPDLFPDPQEHPPFASAMALSTIILVQMVPLILLQRRVAGRRR